jgi:hypothetical protein
MYIYAQNRRLGERQLRMANIDAPMQRTSTWEDNYVPCYGTTEVLLLCQQPAASANTIRLLAGLGVELTCVKVCVLGDIGAVTLDRFDLILYEAGSRYAVELQATLNWVRTSSRAPLVVLAGGASAEEALLALVAGADAVITPAIRQEIAVAHCHALLRRWRRARPGLPPVGAALAPQ